MSELQRLRDRVAELEDAFGVTSVIPPEIAPDRFYVVPAVRSIMGILLNREFVSKDALFTVLYGDRPESDWPDPKILDIRICQARKALRPHDISIKTVWGKGWMMDAENKAKLRALIAKHSQGRAAA